MTQGTRQGPLELADDSTPARPLTSPSESGSQILRAVMTPAIASQSTLLDQAYQAFCDRTEAGERLDLEAFCAQFPTLQSSLPRLLQAHRFLEDRWADSPCDQDIHWPEPGDTFLDYRLVLELGKGAFARVFLATEPKLGDRLVAVKIARQGGAAEAQTLGRLKHPNIAPVHSVTENRAEGWTLVCMPYLGSATLHNVLDRVKAEGKLPIRARLFLAAANDLIHPLDPTAHPAAPDRLLETASYLDGVRWLGAQLAEALTFIHGRGVCHLDLKPSNVLLSPAGTPMLLDFNLSSDSRREQHRFGGTLPYMSPEQLQASDGHGPPAPVGTVGAVGAKSDLFSLGVLLHELVTGVHPFGPIPLKASTDELRSLILDRQQAGFMPVRQVNADVDPVFADLIERCLANDPARRPESAGEIASALRGDLRPTRRAQRWVARNSKKTLAGVALCVLFGVAALAAWALSPPASERHYAAGIESYRRGNYQAGAELLTEALKADKTSAKAFFARGRAYQKLGPSDRTLYNLAIEDFRQAQKLAPDGQNLAAIGYCFHLLGQKHPALYWYRESEQAGFVTAELLNNIGLCLMETGKLEEAQPYLAKAIETDTNLTAAYRNRATLLTDAAQNRIGYLDHNAKDPEGAMVMSPGDKKKMQEELASALTLGQKDIEKVLELGPPNGELSFQAACFYAVASHVEPAWKKDALRHLANAVQKQGFDASRLKGNHLLASLCDEPEFQNLSALPAPQGPMSRPARFIDPIKDSAP